MSVEHAKANWVIGPSSRMEISLFILYIPEVFALNIDGQFVKEEIGIFVSLEVDTDLNISLC